MANSSNPWFRIEGNARDFWLVQRMRQVEPRPGRTGVDEVFSMDYMGSAEYEGNMAFLSLQAMRAHGAHEIRVALINRDGITREVFFVGPAETLDQSIRSFREWFGEKSLRSQEPSRFDRSFNGSVLDEDDRAWWAFRAGVVFTLELAVADKALEVFQPLEPKTERFAIPFLSGVSLLNRWKLSRIPASTREEYLARVPTRPGRYYDSNGCLWTLDVDGVWTDRRGRPEQPRYNWVLGQWIFTRLAD